MSFLLFFLINLHDWFAWSGVEVEIYQLTVTLTVSLAVLSVVMMETALLLTTSTTTSTTSSQLTEQLASGRWRRQTGGDMPVVFLPEESDTQCLPSNRMSAFGFLAFVVQSVNGTSY